MPQGFAEAGKPITDLSVIAATAPGSAAESPSMQITLASDFLLIPSAAQTPGETSSNPLNKKLSSLCTLPSTFYLKAL